MASCLACFFVFFAILALQGVLLNVLPANLFARLQVFVQGALGIFGLLALALSAVLGIRKLTRTSSRISARLRSPRSR